MAGLRLELERVANRVLRHLADGAEVEVRYNPENPPGKKAWSVITARRRAPLSEGWVMVGVYTDPAIALQDVMDDLLASV